MADIEPGIYLDRGMLTFRTDKEWLGGVGDPINQNLVGMPRLVARWVSGRYGPFGKYEPTEGAQK